MEKKCLELHYTTAKTIDELPAQDRELLDAARSATETSYAPFSDFYVGAALLLSNGIILKGSNQENTSFPVSLCAERTVLLYAHANYPNERVCAMAIATRTKDGFTSIPTAPCGTCRQALLESEKRAGQAIKLILGGEDHILIIPSIADILPFGFNSIP